MTDHYRLAIVAVGHWSFSTVFPQSSQPADASAERITEAPTSCTATKCKVLPLTDFGSIGYPSASTNGEAVSGGSSLATFPGRDTTGIAT